LVLYWFSQVIAKKVNFVSHVSIVCYCVPITNDVSVTLLKRGVFDTTLGDKVSLGLAAAQWFSPGTLVSSTNKTDCHDKAEIFLKFIEL
jgi:hypothetical protein